VGGGGGGGGGVGRPVPSEGRNGPNQPERRIKARPEAAPKKRRAAARRSSRHEDSTEKTERKEYRETYQQGGSRNPTANEQRPSSILETPKLLSFSCSEKIIAQRNYASGGGC